ncbi:PqqD family protein [Nonomuraea typhae]|uniref:PqqD family protein n=1 Tax=Nonomuraea typhae TaxID=2603600 RepID=UPI0012F9C67A|nr:PqqD family protein [Nonomuraea typhae]
MSLLQLAEHAVFDDTDDAGVILDTSTGVYLSLNVTATLMLQAALRSDTLEEAIGHLETRIDASGDTLAQGMARLTTQLAERSLLALEAGVSRPARGTGDPR